MANGTIFGDLLDLGKTAVSETVGAARDVVTTAREAIPSVIDGVIRREFFPETHPGETTVKSEPEIQPAPPAQLVDLDGRTNMVMLTVAVIAAFAVAVILARK